MSFTFQVEAGKTLRLPTALKVCPQDILITGAGGNTEEAYREGYNKGYADGFVCDFSKMEYVRLYDLNGFTKSDVTLYLGDTGLTRQDFSYSAYRANNQVERLTLNVKEGIESISFNCYNTSVMDSKLKHITLNMPTAKFSTGYTIFYNCRALEVIDGTPIDLSPDTRGAACEFVGCTALREVRFAPNTIRGAMWFGNSQYLSNDSTQSVIDGLMDLTGQSTKTLTFHATVGGKLTEAQKAAVTAKNWTLVY